MTHRQRKPMRRTREMEYHFLDYPNSIKRDAILWLKFDDSDQGASALVGDHGDFGNRGVNDGSTKTVGRNGIAKSFDGVDDNVDCGNDSRLNLTNGFTIAFWFKPTITLINTATLYDKRFLSAYGMTATGTKALLSTIKTSSGFSQVSTGNIITENRWYFITTTYNLVKHAIYSDGVLRESIDSTNPVLISSTSNFTVGSERDNMNYFKMDMDEFIVWDRGLTPQEIKDLYEGDLL